MFAFLSAGGVFALDRLTKWIVETRFSFFDTYRVIPGYFDIVRSQNRGVAFGILNDSASPWSSALLIAAALAAVAAVATMLWKADRRMDGQSMWGLALILGGAAGNVFDRIVWGRVTDFLLLYVRDYQWPTFNLADSAIVAGSTLLILDLLRSKRRSASHAA
jgi:signal peptidase II